MKKDNKVVLRSIVYSNLPTQFKQKNKKCEICLFKIKENEIIKLFSCNKHIFHMDCIKLWLEKRKKCPICKEEFLFKNYYKF